MAKSVFRRFPSDDLEIEMPEWNDVNVNGQAFVRTGVNAKAWDICEDFWEAEPPAPPAGQPIMLRDSVPFLARANLWRPR